MSEAIEQVILAHSLAHPAHGPVRVSHELALQGLQVSSTGVRGVRSRHDLLTRDKRLLRLETSVAKQPFDLSAEHVRLLERFSPEFRERHIETRHTGELVAVDTFTIDNARIGSATVPLNAQATFQSAPTRRFTRAVTDAG